MLVNSAKPGGGWLGNSHEHVVKWDVWMEDVIIPAAKKFGVPVNNRTLGRSRRNGGITCGGGYLYQFCLSRCCRQHTPAHHKLVGEKALRAGLGKAAEPSAGASSLPLDCLASTYRSDFRYKFKVTSPKHRRPDRHNLSLMNPQQYFFGCAIVRYRHLSTSIAYFS